LIPEVNHQSQGDNPSDFPSQQGNICQVCLDNATVRQAVGAIGSHYDWDNSRGTGAPCQELRENYGMPLMISEGHHGAVIKAKVGGNITGYGQWPLFAGFILSRLTHVSTAIRAQECKHGSR